MLDRGPFLVERGLRRALHAARARVRVASEGDVYDRVCVDLQPREGGRRNARRRARAADLVRSEGATSDARTSAVAHDSK